MACVGGLGLAGVVPAPQPLLLPRLTPAIAGFAIAGCVPAVAVGIRRCAARHGAPRAGGAVIHPAVISRV
jgi:hypothetical protein